MTAAVWVLGLQLLCAQPPAPIEEAEIAFAALRYDQAEGMAKLTLTEAGSSANDRARAHRVLGQLAAIRGDPATAEQHFLRMLEADPTVVIEERASPKIRGPFEAAQARVGERPPAPPAVEEEPAVEAPPPPAASDADAPTPPAPPAPGPHGDNWLLWGTLGTIGLVAVAGVVAAGVAIFALSARDPCAGTPSCATPP